MMLGIFLGDPCYNHDSPPPGSSASHIHSFCHLPPPTPPKARAAVRANQAFRQNAMLGPPHPWAWLPLRWQYQPMFFFFSKLFYYYYYFHFEGLLVLYHASRERVCVFLGGWGGEQRRGGVASGAYNTEPSFPLPSFQSSLAGSAGHV